MLWVLHVHFFTLIVGVPVSLSQPGCCSTHGHLFFEFLWSFHCQNAAERNNDDGFYQGSLHATIQHHPPQKSGPTFYPAEKSIAKPSMVIHVHILTDQTMWCQKLKCNLVGHHYEDVPHGTTGFYRTKFRVHVRTCTSDRSRDLPWITPGYPI